MGTAVANRDMVGGLQTFLEGEATAIQKVIAEHVTAERLIKVAITAVLKNPALLECSQESMALALIEVGGLGLEPTGVLGQAYLVPYYNKNTQQKEVQLQVGYRGMAELVYRGGRVYDIDPQVVRDGDEFEYRLGLDPVLTHKPAEGRPDDEGVLTYAYAVARFNNGHSKFVVLTREEVNKIRAASKASQRGPWVDWESEMWKKSAVRRLCKSLPMSTELERAIAKDDAVSTGSLTPAEVIGSEPLPSKSERMAEDLAGSPDKDEDLDKPPTRGEVRQLKELLDTLGGTPVVTDQEADELDVAIEQKQGRAIREAIVDLQKRALDAQPA